MIVAFQPNDDTDMRGAAWRAAWHGGVSGLARPLPDRTAGLAVSAPIAEEKKGRNKEVKKRK